MSVKRWALKVVPHVFKGYDFSLRMLANILDAFRGKWPMKRLWRLQTSNGMSSEDRGRSHNWLWAREEIQNIKKHLKYGHMTIRTDGILLGNVIFVAESWGCPDFSGWIMGVYRKWASKRVFWQVSIYQPIMKYSNKYFNNI